MQSRTLNADAVSIMSRICLVGTCQRLPDILAKYPTGPCRTVRSSLNTLNTPVRARYQLNTGTRYFGKIGNNPIPVPRVPVYLRPQYRGYGYLVRYGLDPGNRHFGKFDIFPTDARHFGKFGVSSILVPDPSVNSVNRYRYPTPR